MAMITRLKVHKEYADIELGDLGYLYIVWEFVLRFYNGKSTKNLDAFSGSCSVKGRKQNGFDRVVNLTERMTGYYWPYKPEVTFSVPMGTSNIVPVPHLTNDRKASKREEKEAQSFIDKIGRKIGLLDKTTQGKNRRHTRWKCSAPVLPGAKRKRPDLIIVEDYHIRWPGRETLAYGEQYEDNLKRLVEMKYGIDSLEPEQKEAYIKIATVKRFSLLEIYQDDDEGNTEGVYEFSPEFVPAFGFKKEDLLPKIRLEPWVAAPEGRPINILSEKLIDRKSMETAYHAETAAQILQNSPWLEGFGKFESTENGIRWVGDDGKIVEYSNQELQQAVDYLEEYEDIPRDYLPYIQEADVVMSTDNALMVAVNFVKENKEEIVTFIVLSVATIALAYFASAALAGSIMFALRLAVFAPALGVSANLWAADERFEQRSNCYAYKYLVNKPKGSTYEPHEYKITHYVPWQACEKNADTSHLKGWEEKVREFDARHDNLPNE